MVVVIIVTKIINNFDEEIRIANWPNIRVNVFQGKAKKIKINGSC